jgi:hypothetical protein
MSKQLETVVQRAISDAAFRRQLQSNPEAALRGFKLTQDEVAALRSGDASKLMSLGIDQRMSKVFTVPGEQLNRAAAGDLSTGSSSALSDTSAVLRDPDNPANAAGYVGDPGGSTSHASILRDPENPANARGYIGGQASSSDAIVDQGGSTSHVSVLGDPENPAYDPDV